MICVINTLNYGYTYFAGPIFYQSPETIAQNERFIPYGKQYRDGASEIMF